MADQAGRRPEDCLAGGGEMGALMRSFDWGRTPLGPVERWPQSLRTAVSIMLESRFGMYVAWGPEFTQFYNDGYRPILGSTKHPALGKGTRETFAEIWPIIGPLFEGVMRGEAVGFDDFLLPLDRHGYVEECYFTFSYSPIRDESGGVGGVNVTVTETTDRVIGERRLRTLRDLAARASDTQAEVEAWRRCAEVLKANPKDLPFALVYALPAGQDAAGLVNTGAARTLGEAIAPSTVDLQEGTAPWPLAEVARTGRAVQLTDLAGRFGRLQGPAWPEPLQTAVALPIHRTAQARPYGVLVAGISPRRALDDGYQGFLDLTADHIATAVANARAHEEERRRAEALAELDRAKTVFFGNVSHEFRTPLTLMLGPLEELLAGAGGELASGQRERAELLHRNTLRLLRLVNALLDFSRLEAGRIEACYEPTDLARLTAELASVFRSAVEKAGLAFAVDCPPLPEPLYVDRDMWEKVVLNLLSNAFKFTFEGGITVSLRWTGAGAALQVRDTGTGIAAVELPRLFERFRRIPGARSRTHEGTGIGLALVQELARLHGGEVTVQSEPGRGSVFTVTVPAGRAHLPAERIGAPRSRPPTGAGADAYVDEAVRWLPEDTRGEPAEAAPEGTALILVADDNADMRQYLRRLLAPYWQVETVSDGAAALEAARRRAPDVVLADVMMPGLSGFELLRALRGDPRTAAVPVVMLSARAGEEARVEGLNAGADDYLTKPFSTRELIARLRAQVELSRARRMADSWRAEMYELFEQAPAPICVLRGPELVFEMANRRYHEVAGREELVGRPLLEALPELQGQGFDELLLEVMRSGRAHVEREAPMLLNRRSGDAPEQTWWTFTYAPLRSGGGTAERVMAFCTEVTDQVRARRQIEEAWRQAEHLRERLQLAVEATDLGTWEYDSVTGAVYWSERTRRMFGLSPQAVVTYDGFLQRVHPGDRDRVAQAVARALHPQQGGTLELEYRILRGGTKEAWIRSVGQVVFEAEGRPRRLIGTVADATELKHAEHEARLRETIAANATLPLYMTDAQNRCTYMNAAAERMTGLALAEVRGKSLHELIHSRRPDGSPYPVEECPIEATVPRSEPARGEEVFLRPDGSSYPVAFTTSPVLLDGTLLSTGAEVRDLTEQQQAERERTELLRREREARREAEAASGAKDEFLAMLGHELRNPLSPILTALELMRLRGDDVLPKERAIIQRQVEHLVRLVDDLLDVSRIARGKVQLRNRPVELSAVVARAIEMASPLLEERQHRLEARVAGRGLAIYGDEARLAQVVANLLTNAAKYTDPGGVVRVSARREGGEVTLRVRDNGSGIPAELLPNVFHLFTQGERPIDRGQGGLGLGLTIVHSLVTLHRGTVAAHSDGPGRGSEFVVRLPALEGAHAQESLALPPPAPAVTQPRRVLLVDDNRDWAVLMSEALRAMGHDTRVAFDGPAALELADEFRPDVALLDIGLPVMDGYELARRLRGTEGDRLRLVAITGYGQPSDRRRSRRAGFHEHLVKPIEVATVQAVVDRLFSAEPSGVGRP